MIITSNTTSKFVRIRKNGGDEKSIIAMLIQSYNGEDQVLQTKTFSSQERAAKWANKVLN